MSDFGAKRECGLCRRSQLTYRDLIEADRRGRDSAARCTGSWRGCANTPPFGSGKRVFIAEGILHRSPDSVLRVGLEFQAVLSGNRTSDEIATSSHKSDGSQYTPNGSVAALGCRSLSFECGSVESRKGAVRGLLAAVRFP